MLGPILVIVAILVAVILFVRSKNDQAAANYGAPAGAHTLSIALVLLAVIGLLVFIFVILPGLQADLNRIFAF